MLERGRLSVLFGGLGMVVLALMLVFASQVAVGQANDGRLNCDEAAPVVLYCGLTGVDIYDPDGDLILVVPYEDLDIGIPAVNTKVGGTADGSITVYRLTSGEIQVNVINGNELWTARWMDCPSVPAEIEVFSRVTGERLSWERDSCNLPAQPTPTIPPEPDLEVPLDQLT
ncbi:MAG: hypothetical protein Kow0077_23140 [Anaerolineae bacterium]